MSGFRVFFCNHSNQWVAWSEAFPSLSHLADEPTDALTGIMKLQQDMALDLLVEQAEKMGAYKA